MMNAKKNIQNKWFISLCIAMLMGLANMTMLHGMEPEQKQLGPIKEFEMLLNTLPQDVRQHILSFSDAIMFLSQQPITLAKYTGMVTEDRVYFIAIVNDKVVTASSDNTVKIWNIQNGRLLSTFTDPTDRITSVETGDDKVTGDNIVMIQTVNKNTMKEAVTTWDINTRKLLHIFEGHVNESVSGAIKDDIVITEARDNNTANAKRITKIWDISTELPLNTLVGYYPITSIAISDDKVVTGSFDGIIQIWDAQSNRLLHTLTEPDKYFISSVTIGGNRVVTISNTTARIWDIQSGQLLHTLVRPFISTPIAIGDGIVVTGSEDNTAKLWDIQSGQLLHTLTGHAKPVTFVVIGNGVVVTGSEDNTAKIWDIQSGQLLHTLVGHTHRIDKVTIGYGTVVTRSQIDNITKIWDLQSGQLLLTPTRAIGPVAISNGRVATGGDYNTAKIWLLKPFAGTPQNNPLLWIIDNATIPALNLINRAYKTTIARGTLILDSEDLQIFSKLPIPVKRYLLDRLKIRLK